jgi:hypothetical protein
MRAIHLSMNRFFRFLLALFFLNIRRNSEKTEEKEDRVPRKKGGFFGYYRIFLTIQNSRFVGEASYR